MFDGDIIIMLAMFRLDSGPCKFKLRFYFNCSKAELAAPVDSLSKLFMLLSSYYRSGAIRFFEELPIMVLLMFWCRHYVDCTYKFY